MNDFDLIEKDWSIAQERDTLGAYCSFLQTHSENNQYFDLALSKIDAQNDQIRWKNVRDEHTVWAYCHYLHNFPNGRYVNEAHKAIAEIEEDDKWENTVNKKTIRALVEYIGLYPKGKHSKKAEFKIDELELAHEERTQFNKVQQEKTIEAYEAFIQRYPDGFFKDEALKEITFLERINERPEKHPETEDVEWKIAQIKNTLDAYGEFYKKYPKGEYTEQAKNKIEEHEQLLLKKEMQKRELKIWERIQKENNIELCKEYLKNFPKGEYKSEVKKILYQLSEKENDLKMDGLHDAPMSVKTRKLVIIWCVVCVILTIVLQFIFEDETIRFLIMSVGGALLVFFIFRLIFENTK